MNDDSNEHLNIDTLSRMAEEQQKKKLAEETTKEDNKSADKPENTPVDNSDDKVSK